MLKIKTWADLPARSPSLRDNERDAFLLEDMPGPNVEEFRIDFERPWSFTWNKYARIVFCRDFLGALAVGKYAPEDITWLDRIDGDCVSDWVLFKIFPRLNSPNFSVVLGGFCTGLSYHPCNHPVRKILRVMSSIWVCLCTVRKRAGCAQVCTRVAFAASRTAPGIRVLPPEDLLNGRKRGERNRACRWAGLPRRSICANEWYCSWLVTYARWIVRKGSE